MCVFDLEIQYNAVSIYFTRTQFTEDASLNEEKLASNTLTLIVTNVMAELDKKKGKMGSPYPKYVWQLHVRHVLSHKA